MPAVLGSSGKVLDETHLFIQYVIGTRTSSLAFLNYLVIPPIELLLQSI